MPAYQAINAAAGLILPEIMLLLTACIMFLAAPFLVSEAGQGSTGLRHRWGTLSVLAIGCAILALLKATHDETGLGPFRVDSFALLTRGLSLGFGLLLTLVLWDQVEDGLAAEAFACLLVILAGVNFVVLSNDLVGVFLGLELVSIPTYVLLYLSGRDKAAHEATLKYFLLSIFSSALVLFGMSWIFGLTGTTNLTVIGEQVISAKFPLDHGMLRIATILLLGGLCFRLAAVPFHFYAPDVFQGVGPSSAAMLSVVPKVVGFAAILRLMPLCLGEDGISVWLPGGVWGSLLTVIAVATMFLGNLMALRQTNLFRLLAYSSIAHAGYMLVGLAVGNVVDGVNGVSALLFYLSVYGIMTVGVFALLTTAGSTSTAVSTLGSLGGLSKSNPVTAILLAVCIFGLSGLPPTAGFLGKLNLFLAAWSAQSWQGQTLAISLAINAVIAATYYLRLISAMYFEADSTPRDTTPRIASWVAGGVCAAATLGIFLAPQWLWQAAALAVN